jgi:cytochrome c oxidase assembly protein subunit 15
MIAVMQEQEYPSRKGIILWLLSGCLLIFLMVVVGGITRLTGSGLSITEWNVIMGAVPPLNAHDWNTAFQKYQQSPQFLKVNFGMSLSEFKSIFLWEYVHRLIGRLIGVVFLIPFLYFLFRRKLDGSLVRKLMLLFALGALQGFAGWFMVSSGLVDDPHVSHYRLAIHLILAFITFGCTFWIALDLIYVKQSGIISQQVKGVRIILRTIVVLVVLQIIYGAFVAGLHAGSDYNTFPKMGPEWVAGAVTAMHPFWKNLSENIAGVQFVHRCIAWTLVVLAGLLLFLSRKKELTVSQRRGIHAFCLAVVLQFCLGVFTLLYGVPLIIGVLHQAGAFVLFATALFSLHATHPLGPPLYEK